MKERTASCACGQLRLTCEGEPLRISICHCLACQKRTGAPFSMNARFAKEAVRIEGESKTFTRQGDSGGSVSFRFCPHCGSTVYWELSGVAGVYAIAAGAFADPHFPEPRVSVYGTRRHHWVDLDSLLPGIEHLD
jgi:hypothetical protein